MFRRGAVMAITVACASFFLIFPASAQSIAEERLSIAREIVELSGATDNMRTMMQSMQPVLREGVRSRGLSEQQADVFVRYFTEEFQGETPRLLEMAAATYADTLQRRGIGRTAGILGKRHGAGVAPESAEHFINDDARGCAHRGTGRIAGGAAHGR